MGMDWIVVAQDRNKQPVVVSAVMNLWIVPNADEGREWL